VGQGEDVSASLHFIDNSLENVCCHAFSTKFLSRFFVADLYACAKHKKIKGSFTASLNPFNLNLNYEKNLPVLFAWHKDKDFFI